jgi:trk system potassium uptake protein TrkA
VKAIIVGCGRVGSVLADAFDRAGHQVVIVDLKTTAFDRLPGTFRGAAIRGDGTDEDTLRRAGAEGADVFMAMTEGDNRNVMSAQLATEALGVRQVVAKINDPLRASAYAELGIATLCRTNLMATAISQFVGLGATFGPGLSPATGHHPGGEHHGADEGANDGPAGAAAGGPATAVPGAVSGAGADGPAGISTSSSAGPAFAAPAEPNPAPVAPTSAREG